MVDKRSILLEVNKFQKLVLFPLLVATFIATIVVVVCMEYFQGSILHQDVMVLGFNLTEVPVFVPCLFLTLSLVLFLLANVWAFYISNKILAPYQRIVSELKARCEGKEKKPMTVRKGDEMFGELLKYINVLIAKLP